MGGAFIGFTLGGTGMNACNGHDVMHELNDAFGTPGSDRYIYAQQNHSFDKVNDQPDNNNYRALITAYVDAGVDVCARWGAYLRLLGRTPEGQHDIYLIAQTRWKALQASRPMQTSTHDVNNLPHGGPRVATHDGDPQDHTDPSTIDAPFTPPSTPPKQAKNRPRHRARP